MQLLDLTPSNAKFHERHDMLAKLHLHRPEIPDSQSRPNGTWLGDIDAALVPDTTFIVRPSSAASYSIAFLEPLNRDRNSTTD